MQPAQRPAQESHQVTLLDQQRFTRLWKLFCAEFDPSHCEAVFAELAGHYVEASRHYHTDAHIQHCLSQLDASNDPGTTHPHVEMAIWCHDVIYTPGDPENEKNSALWFRDKARGHFRADDIEQIVKIITITEHRDTPGSDSEQLMVDIDLSSFGLPSGQFEKDGDRVRLEFSELSDEDFIAGQITFLQSLLDRPALYSTTFFHDNFEDIARSNIQKLLARYRTGLIH